MKFSLKILVALILSCVAASAQSGKPLVQSGNVTPTHVWCVTTNGIAQDCGTAAIPFATTFGTWGTGPTNCAWTALVTSGAAQQICLGGTTSGGAELYVQNYGTAPALPLTFSLNGTKYQFPYTVGGVVGPNPTVIGGVAVWGNGVGSLLADGASHDGYFGSGRPWCDPRAKGAVGNGSTDDTVAFNACVTALATGGIIFISPGQYCLKTATSNHVAFVINSVWTFRIIGTGARNTVILETCGANVQPISLQAGGYSEISNVQINGYGSPSDTGLPSHPALSLLATNGGGHSLHDVSIFYGSPPLLVQENDCELDHVIATEGYGAANMVFQNANGCRVSGNSSVDQGAPVIGPAVNSLSSFASWASSTYFGSSFTGSISGTTLTTSATTGTITIGELVTGAGVAANTQIIAGSGTSWTVSASQSVGSEAMTGTGDIVTNSGYRMQLVTNGTSGGSAPTVKPYGVNFTDGSAVWQLYNQSGFALIDIDTGSSEMILDGMDISGVMDYDLEFTNTLSGSPPQHVTVAHATLGGVPLLASVYLQYGYGFGQSHTHVTGPALNATSQINIASTYSGGARFTDNEFIGGGTNYAIYVAGGDDFTVAANDIHGGYFFGAGNSSANISVTGNVTNGGVGHCEDLSNSVDYITFSGNACNGASVTNSSSGTHNFIVNNPGYNPVGLTAGTSTGTSTSTITAGASPETHYITQSSNFNAVVKSGSTTLCTVPSATVPCVVDLGPNESYSVTWSTTQPTYSKFVH